MYPLEKVMEMWKGKELPAATELRADELWEIPLAPPEDILRWLDRIGRLADEDEFELKTISTLLEDEFDLEEEGVAEAAEVKQGDELGVGLRFESLGQGEGAKAALVDRVGLENPAL
jgi:hypothetical protein